MINRIIKLYDYFSIHRRGMFALLAALTLMLVMLIMHINYKEDITDFLPLGGRDQEAMRIYQNISGANRIIALIGYNDTTLTADADDVASAIDDFHRNLVKAGIKEDDITWRIDMEKMSAAAGKMYAAAPSLLSSSDYERIKKQLSDSAFIHRQLSADVQMLMLPTGGLLSENIGIDPLNLFTPAIEQMSHQSQAANFELYDGYILMPDMKRAVVMITSPYGSSETEHNRELTELISQAAETTMKTHHQVNISITGGPVIAVGNASQMKADSIISVSIAVVLILLLLFVSFRSVRNIVLIAITIAWGWIFALGGLSIVNSNISVIVIGISSVILGIAINYPLHLIAHTAHAVDMRHALKEIIAPLLVGNITTIGAFLTLVPLRSIALRDLGLFAALLLMGTILFVMIFLPHMVKRVPEAGHQWLNRLSNVQPDSHPWLVVVVAVLTVVFAIFSLTTGFDTNLSNINYMSASQRADMDYLAKQQNPSEKTKTIYVVSTGSTLDEALMANETIEPSLGMLSQKHIADNIVGPSKMVASKHERARRDSLWKDFSRSYSEAIATKVNAEAASLGFAPESFDEFFNVLKNDKAGASQSSSASQAMNDGKVFYDEKTKTFNVVNTITLQEDNLDKADAIIAAHIDDASHYHFEIGKLNSVVATSLSDNFNYIGYACALIVFFFLWFSMRNFELAALSFLPMAVSWLWILGIMGMLGIDFNIVNIILATFIFGQGDDYTIFMTEGCQYEYSYGRKILPAYKNSILISALIMFIGMGALIFARHPALHSLAVVTIIGMFSVVLMAYLLPPFAFRWLVTKRGEPRRRPLTLRSLLMPKRYPSVLAAGSGVEEAKAYVRDAYYYCSPDVVAAVKKSIAKATDSISADGSVDAEEGDYGSKALLLALLHPERKIIAHPANDDDEAVMKNIACRIAKNIEIAKS